MTLPRLIKAEVKFTTGTSVSLSARELNALRETGDHGVGLVAVLFWCNDRDVDGHWLVTDASNLRVHRSTQTVTVSKGDLRRANNRKEPRLCDLREHLRRCWPPFLQAFLDEAIRGRLELVEELRRCHQEQRLAERLPKYDILEADHRLGIARIVEGWGESVAGHIFQDFFAYLVAQLGYRDVTLNPVGVPDVTLTSLDDLLEVQPVASLASLTSDELRRLTRYCHEAGDSELADRLRKLSAESDSPPGAPVKAT
jgi:hypothetical protein